MMSLDQRSLGTSQVAVTSFIFGGASIGGLFSPVTDEAAEATLEAAWHAGVRAFDTAPHYGVGLSEARIGRFLGGHRRSEAVISTKVGRLLVPADRDVEGEHCFYGIPRRQRVEDNSGAGARRSIEESCARMGVDRIDIALVHDPDEHYAEALQGALPALLEMRSAGIVGAVGVSMNQSHLLARFANEADIDCVMVAGRWSLLDRSAGADLLPICAERGVAVLVGGVLNSGILASPRPGATFDYAPATPERLEAAYRLEQLCRRYGVALHTAALQFPLRHPAVTAIVVGGRTPAEVAADFSALGTPVPDELWAELDSTFQDGGLR
jgi:D-threo-aldose 1-dehydrogenase